MTNVAKIPITLGLLSISFCLFLLYFVDLHSGLHPQGLLTAEAYQFQATSARPHFIIDSRQYLFASTIFFVGVMSLWIRFFKLTASFRFLPLLNGVIICAILLWYFVNSYEMPVDSILYGFLFTGLFIIFKTTKNLKVKRNINYSFYIASIIALLILIEKMRKFGYISEITSQDTLFNIDNHLSKLLSSAYRLADGYHWFHGTYPTYGILLPELTALILKPFSFSLASWFFILQALKSIFILMLLAAVFLQSKSPLSYIYMCCTLMLFTQSNTLIYFQNHCAWRYMGVALTMLFLSLACYFRKRLSCLLKSLIACLAIFLNLETGVILSIGFFCSEVFSQKQAFLRAIKFCFYLVIFIGVTLHLFQGLSFKTMTNYLFFFSGGMGGWPYFAIPAFATLFLHAAIIIWRTAKSGIRYAEQDIALVAAMYCLLWSMYFVTRPASINFPSLLLVYALLAYRLWSDISWVIKNPRWLTNATVGLMMFAYVSILITFLSNGSMNLIPISNLSAMKTLQPIHFASDELKVHYHDGDNYITPFPFFTRAMSGKSNNLSTADPFTLIDTQSEQNAFLKGPFSNTVFLPKVDALFIYSPTPPQYNALLMKIKNSLTVKKYKVIHSMQYWIEYRQKLGVNDAKME